MFVVAAPLTTRHKGTLVTAKRNVDRQCVRNAPTQARGAHTMHIGITVKPAITALMVFVTTLMKTIIHLVRLLEEGALVWKPGAKPSEVAHGAASAIDAFPNPAAEKFQHQNVKKMSNVFRQLELAGTRSAILSLIEV